MNIEILEDEVVRDEYVISRCMTNLCPSFLYFAFISSNCWICQLNENLIEFRYTYIITYIVKLKHK